MSQDYKVEEIGTEMKIQTTENHNFGTDAILLFDFAEVKRKDRVCDFGTGCGIIGVLTAKASENCVWGIDIQPAAIKQAKVSAQLSGLADRFIPIVCDINEIKTKLAYSGFTLVTCNPPYYKPDSGFVSENEAKAIARQEIKCNINDVAREAYNCLADKGRLCICHKPERMAEVLAVFNKNRLEPKRLQFVKSGNDKAPWLFLLEGRKNGAPGLRILPDLIIKPGEEPTDTYRKYRKEMGK